MAISHIVWDLMHMWAGLGQGRGSQVRGQVGGQVGGGVGLQELKRLCAEDKKPLAVSSQHSLLSRQSQSTLPASSSWQHSSPAVPPSVEVDSPQAPPGSPCRQGAVAA